MKPEMVAEPHILREYALLADGQRGALVGPRGDLSWLCAPRWDGDAVFSLLLGGSARYTVAPTGRCVWGGDYEPGTLIWHTRWTCGSSVVECREALAYPGDPHRIVVLRRITAARGPAEVGVLLRPAAGFGSEPVRDAHRTDDGVWSARVGPLRLRWTGGATATAVDTDNGVSWDDTFTLPAGGRHDLVLELSDTALPDRPPDPDMCWEATESAWQRQVPALSSTAAPRDSAQAWAVLRGMTGEGGGMVAAATTGLPESAGQGENYDYRYVWIRDQCFAGQAVAAAGPGAGDRPHELLDDAVHFVGERLLADGPNLRPVYTVAGRPVPAPRELDLPGYPGGRSVAGNGAGDQFQLDVFGEALLLFAAAGRHDRLGPEHRRAVSSAVSAIAAHRDTPGAGVWELDYRRWAHSRLTCAAGLRAVAAQPSTGVDVAACTALADALVADAAGTCLHPTGRWQRAQSDPGVDAALVFPMIRGGVPIDDPRSIATYRAVERELSSDFFIYRYRHDQRPLESAEGAFLLCGFAMSIAAAQLGRPVSAARYFERNRAACGTPGLFAEEFDVVQRQLRGNLPQAFVHAMLLESSIRLGEIG